MADKPKTGEVQLKNNPLVKQHKRMAAGEKITGQAASTAPKGKKTSA